MNDKELTEKRKEFEEKVKIALTNYELLQSSQIKHVQSLINIYGIDYIDFEGSTLLQHANFKNTKYLLDHNFPFSLDMKNKHGATALFNSCAKKTQLLLESGADVNALDIYGENALFTCENQEVIDILLAYNIDCNIVNKENSTVIFGASKEKIEKILKTKGVKIDINHRNIDGENALFGADLDSIVYLCSLGIDTQNKNNNNDNALLSVLFYEYSIRERKKQEVMDIMEGKEIQSSIKERLYYLIEHGKVSPYEKNREGVCVFDLFDDELKAFCQRILIRNNIKSTSVSAMKKRI